MEKVALNFGTPAERHVDHLTAVEARRYLAEGCHFAAGSMAPKIQAILDYLDRGGTEAIVTDPDNVERALAGETGTRFTDDRGAQHDHDVFHPQRRSCRSRRRTPHLLSALREELDVTSPKDGCSPSGQCGCCTVLIDGKAIISCAVRSRGSPASR